MSPTMRTTMEIAIDISSGLKIASLNFFLRKLPNRYARILSTTPANREF
jgi:hypothetical protein